MKRLVASIVFALSLITTPSLFAAAPAAAQGDGKLTIFNYHADEYAEITYREGNKILPNGIAAIQSIFRSRDGGGEHAIDLKLIELIDHLQDHFGAETIELISGYRSPALNKSLAAEGHKVASESFHLTGLAADIHFDEINEDELFEYAASLKRGNVGLYRKHNFVHVDVGPGTRTWSDDEPKQRTLLGTQNNPNPAWAAITDKDLYRRGETVQAAITNASYKGERLHKNVWFERFGKGRWGSQEKLENAGSDSVDPGKSSNYSWAIPKDATPGKYRLVVFASKDFSIPPSYSNEFFIKR